jgi:hypothetical protein
MKIVGSGSASGSFGQRRGYADYPSGEEGGISLVI